MKLSPSLLLLPFVAVPLSAAAQSDSTATTKLTHELLAEARRDSAAVRIIDLPLAGSPASRLDMMPAAAFYGPWVAPWGVGGPYAWSLHEGFNARVGFSVSAGLGKHRPKGAGFGEHFAAAYAVPFGKDKRWIGALGVYADRLDWGSYHRTEAGIAGIIGYSVNDWCNLYAYGAYNAIPGHASGPNPFALRYGGLGYGCGPWGYGACLDPYANLRGRVGVAAEFKVSPSFSFSVGFEHDFYDSPNIVPVVSSPRQAPAGRPFSVSDTTK